MTAVPIWPLLALAVVAGCRSPAPALYGAGLFTTSAWDFFLAFAPDQKHVVFGRADDAFEHYDLYETRLGDGGEWSSPVKPRFADRWSNADPHFSPDGKKLFYISNRPEAGETAQDTYDIWMVPLRASGDWGEAERLPAPVNAPGVDEFSPAVAASGNLYFGADRPGTHGGSDLWVARLVDGVYQMPENLGEGVNTAAHEVEPWIAPDESYLIFSALRRADGKGGYDIYLSRKLGDRWGKAKPLGAGINSSDSEWNQSVSPDGNWLYFSSNRPRPGGNGKGDNYRVPMAVLGL
jgi:hypothetical protein